MKIPCDKYLVVHTVDETLEIITEAHGKARIVGGGSDLLLELQQGKHPPVQTLVDVTEVDEMCELGIRDSIIIHRGIRHPHPDNEFLIT